MPGHDQSNRRVHSRAWFGIILVATALVVSRPARGQDDPGADSPDRLERLPRRPGVVPEHVGVELPPGQFGAEHVGAGPGGQTGQDLAGVD